MCATLWRTLLVCSACTKHAGVVCLQAGEGLTALRFSDSGLQCAVGTQNGLVALYDLRSSRPSIVKDHNYGAPIKDIKFHTSGSMAGGCMHDSEFIDLRLLLVWCHGVVPAMRSKMVCSSSAA